MYQNIGHTDYRIFRVFSDRYLNYCSIFFHYCSVKSQRRCHPLIFFDAAIIMRIQICHSAVFVQRFLLDIQPRGINMRTNKQHSLFHRVCSDFHHNYCLVHIDCIYLIAGFQRFPVFQDFLQITVSMFPGNTADIGRTLPFCFSGIQKFFVHTCQCFYILFLCFSILHHLMSLPFRLHGVDESP